jgi:2-methylisocitrate lyase-like PEP mutase family enzyme
VGAATKLRNLFASGHIAVAPGAYDGLSARLVAQAGFPAIYASGGAIARSAGVPDLGLIPVDAIVDRLASMVDVVDIPIIADADTGYGNALNAQAAARAFERAGVAAFHLEDQSFPKKCGHYDDKSLVPVGEMVQKLKAVRDALHDPDFVVIARTDAIAVEGFAAAIDRALAYREAGADMLFVEAPRSSGDLARMVSALGPSLPLMANMVEGGKTPTFPASELESIGFALVIFPGAIVRAFGYMASEFYTSLATHGSNEPFRNRMLDFTGINELVGTPAMIALGQQYETPAQPANKKASTRR